MKTALLVCCLLIGILSAHGVDKKEDKSKVTPDVDITKTKASESKDKRQIGSSDTASYSNEKHDDPEQPQETIYGPKRNQFLIRPLSPHDQQLRNYQPTSRPHSQQLQALGPQLEQSQEIQHYAYLQDTSRNQQGKAIAEGKSHALVKKPSTVQLQQYAEEQYAQQQLQSQAHAAQVQFTPAHGQFRPSAYIPAQPQQEQQPQEVAQYQALQEEHLLKLIEEELRARALQEAQSRASYPQGSQQIRPSERQGLVHYRSKFEEGPDFPSYAPRAGPHHQGPQYLPQQQQQQQQQHIRIQTQQPTQSAPVNFYHGPSAVSYRTLPNNPLAEASFEKELEKLMASNRPLTFRHSSPSALHTGRSPFLQPKSYSTTASPSTTVGQASQYYSPSIVQYSGFQPSPTAPTINQEHQQHKKYAPPSAYSTSQPQYLIESSPAPSKSSKSSSSSSGGQYRVKLHTSKSKSSQAKQNVGPVQFYYGEQQQQQEQPQHSQQQAPTQQQQQEYQQYAPLVTSAAPSQSSIFVSQSTGLQPSQKTKVQGASKQLELPPPDGKPITQAEFQALVDAGYPVQAVPVPVPVPYDQYIKDHPEYQGEPVEIPQQRHSQRSAVSEDSEVRYLRPSSSERHYQQSRRPRDQKEEVAPGKNESS